MEKALKYSIYKTVTFGPRENVKDFQNFVSFNFYSS